MEIFLEINDKDCESALRILLNTIIFQRCYGYCGIDESVDTIDETEICFCSVSSNDKNDSKLIDSINKLIIDATSFYKNHHCVKVVLNWHKSQSNGNVKQSGSLLSLGSWFYDSKKQSSSNDSQIWESWSICLKSKSIDSSSIKHQQFQQLLIDIVQHAQNDALVPPITVESQYNRAFSFSFDAKIDESLNQIPPQNSSIIGILRSFVLNDNLALTSINS